MDEKQIDSGKSAKRRFLRPRISLRTLLTVMAILCVAFGYSALHWRSAKRQEAAADALKDLGGHWKFQYALSYASDPALSPKQAAWAPEWLCERLGPHFFETVRSIDFAGDPANPKRPRITDAAMELLQQFPGLRELSLHSTDVTDRGVEQLEHCPEMHSLSFSDNKNITPEAMKSVKKLRHLYTLYSSGTLNSEEGMAHLKEIPQLRALRISDHRIESTITNEALKHIGELKSLHMLSIGSASVTDEGLLHLENLPELKALILISTKVTPEGVKRLERALPNCTIYAPPISQAPAFGE